MDNFCSRLGLRVYRISVKDDLNVGTVFQHLAEDYVGKVGTIQYLVEDYVGKVGTIHHLVEDYLRKALEVF